MDYIIVLTTTPSIKVARQIARALVTKRLAACVNIIPHIQSIYRWKKKLCDETEVLLLIKTRKSLYNKLQTTLKSLHPYEVPEIISLDITRGSKDYLDWIVETT